MYTIFAGFASLFLYKWRGKFYWESKIQQYYPERKHIMREIYLSISTLVIFGLVLLFVAWANPSAMATTEASCNAKIY